MAHGSCLELATSAHGQSRRNAGSAMTLAVMHQPLTDRVQRPIYLWTAAGRLSKTAFAPSALRSARAQPRVAWLVMGWPLDGVTVQPWQDDDGVANAEAS